MDSLDRIIQEAQGLLQRLIASKTALQLEQQTQQTLQPANPGTSLPAPVAVASLSSTPQNHVRVALRDLTSIAQEAVVFSTSFLSSLDLDNGTAETASFTSGAAAELTQRTPLPRLLRITHSPPIMTRQLSHQELRDQSRIFCVPIPRHR